MDLFEQVAKRWSLTLGTEISRAKVGRCLIDLEFLANLDPLRALPVVRVPGTGREPDLNERQLDVVGLQLRSVRDRLWVVLADW